LNRSAGVLEWNTAIFDLGAVEDWWADRALKGAWNADSLRAVFVERWGRPLDIGPTPIDCVDLFEHPKAITIGHWRTGKEEAWVFVMSAEGSVLGTESVYPVLRVALGKIGVTHCWGEVHPSESDRIRP
jgi:hypothetical protein